MIPVVEKMEVFPVAGHDCMELNLSGAHAPYFTRNIVILTDSNGVEGVGEVPVITFLCNNRSAPCTGRTRGSFSPQNLLHCQYMAVRH